MCQSFCQKCTLFLEKHKLLLHSLVVIAKQRKSTKCVCWLRRRKERVEVGKAKTIGFLLSVGEGGGWEEGAGLPHRDPYTRVVCSECLTFLCLRRCPQPAGLRSTSPADRRALRKFDCTRQLLPRTPVPPVRLSEGLFAAVVRSKKRFASCTPSKTNKQKKRVCELTFCTLVVL